MLREQTVLSIVVPVFNEAESITETTCRLLSLRDRIKHEVTVELLFVDDGSKDKSLELLRNFAGEHHYIKVVSFSRNFGHQIAITAGIEYATGDYVAVIDADLQDPPELIEDMYRLAVQGYDVVYGKRRSRTGETVFKKLSATLFYRVLSYMCEIEIPVDTGDFRLMSRRAVNVLKQLREKHRFVRGMVPWLGFRSIPLEYDRQQRFAGETKYPLRKMLPFAMNAILSFSKKPLTLATRLGFVTILVGFLGGVSMLYLRLFTSITVPGITAVLLTIVIFSGVQIFLLGIVGEYIARIFEEAKDRPLYIVAETFNL